MWPPFGDDAIRRAMSVEVKGLAQEIINPEASSDPPKQRNDQHWDVW